MNLVKAELLALVMIAVVLTSGCSKKEAPSANKMADKAKPVVEPKVTANSGVNTPPPVISQAPILKPTFDVWSQKTAQQKYDTYINWLFIFREAVPSKKKEVLTAIQTAGLSEEEKAELEKLRLHFGIPPLH